MRTYRPSRRRLVLRIVFLCLLLSAAQFLLDARGEYDRLELWTLDRRFQIRGPRPPHGDVVVIGIDDASLSLYGRWPWSRRKHADLVRYLTKAGARLIVFDLLFSEPDTTGEKPDQQFARALHQSGRVLLAMQYTPPQQAPGAVAAPLFVDPSLLDSFDLLRARSPRLPPVVPPWLLPPKEQNFWSLPTSSLARAARGCGFIDIDPDQDGIFRRIQPAFSVTNQRLYLHLGVAAAAEALGIPPDRITLDGERSLRLGNRRSIPVDPDGKLLIDFAGTATRRAGEGLREMGPSVFPYFSYSAVLEGRELPAKFKDKIVFVGAIARGLGDLRPNPFDPAGTGVDVNAHVTDAILANRLPRTLPPWAFPALMLLLTILLCLALTARTPLLAAAATLVIACSYLAVAYLLFARGGLTVPVATPISTVVVCFTAVMTLRFATEQREQRRVRRFFERYVTPEVATAILEDPAAAQMGGRRSELTMLFADVRGFTAMSEKLPAEVVIGMLNDYFAMVVPIIERYRGTTNAFMGDGIFAFWGAPLAQADQAERAVLCGLDMLDCMPVLHTRWRERDLPPLEIGIGIHLGTAVIGNIGTERRSHYTAIGDDVNTASRLEGLNSQIGTKFLISEAVYQRVAPMVHARRLAPLPVKNKAEPLQVYEVQGRQEALVRMVEASAAPREGGDSSSATG